MVEEINRNLDLGKTLVNDGTYKKTKVDNSIGQLFEDGDLRAAIDFEPSDTDHVEVGVFDSGEAAKAYGHNTGFKGHPNERKMKKHKREFIPAPNKTFIEKITKKIKRTIKDIKDGN